MTLDGLLLALVAFSIPFDLPILIILIYGAMKRPRIRVLQVWAGFTAITILGLSTYVWAVANAAFGYVLPKEIAQIMLRGVFLGLALFPYLFLYLFLTGKFRDAGWGGPDGDDE